MAPQRRPGAVDSRLARSPGALSCRAASTATTVAERSDGTAKRRRGRGNSEQAGGGDRPGHRAYSLDARPAACGLRQAAGVQAPCSPAEPAPRGASIGGRQTEDGGRRTRAARAGAAVRSARRSRRAPHSRHTHNIRRKPAEALHALRLPLLRSSDRPISDRLRSRQRRKEATKESLRAIRRPVADPPPVAELLQRDRLPKRMAGHRPLSHEHQAPSAINDTAARHAQLRNRASRPALSHGRSPRHPASH